MSNEHHEYDFIVIGAGPIGIEVAGALKKHGVEYLHFDSQQIGHTISRYARFTKFFSSPERLSICGIPVQTMHQDLITGEEYLTYLRAVVETLDLQIRTYERVVDLHRDEHGDGFVVESESVVGRARFRARRVVIATGDMSFPRLLGVPGEHLPHVTHFLQDPHAYFRKRVLVVGGRNSALEAALRCFRVGAHVGISLREDGIDANRTNSRLNLEISILSDKGAIETMPATEVEEIRRTDVVLRRRSDLIEYPADFVLVCTGYRPDLDLLRRVGVGFSDEDGSPAINPGTMETNVAGLYLAGTATTCGAPGQHAYIGTSHGHTVNILKAVYGISTEHYGDLPSRRYPFAHADVAPGVEGADPEPSPRPAAAAHTNDHGTSTDR